MFSCIKYTATPRYSYDNAYRCNGAHQLAADTDKCHNNFLAWKICSSTTQPFARNHWPTVVIIVITITTITVTNTLQKSTRGGADRRMSNVAAALTDHNSDSTSRRQQHCAVDQSRRKTASPSTEPYQSATSDVQLRHHRYQHTDAPVIEKKAIYTL